MSKISLGTKLVGNIDGIFVVRSYQRGYRWGKEEVERLLDDIYTNGQNNYCLQPIVVKNDGESYELIDGQQRLTTLFLIYKFIHNASNGFLPAPRFSLKYETRKKTVDILNDIDLTKKEENIDYWFICTAYETIADWFNKKDKVSVQTNINKYFDENVKVIWYEVDDSHDTNALFTRLNIGKIPLTSAELVKAMFLCRSYGELQTGNKHNIKPQLDKKKQEEISLQWDSMEKELHNDSLWYFLTNMESRTYQTRIDLILDIKTEKPVDCKDKYYTFFAFDKLHNSEDLDKLWIEIQHTFLILKGWFENHDYYHKIGYLIASRTNSLLEIFNLSIGQTKSEFIEILDKRIQESIRLTSNYGKLSYESKTDYDYISRLLMLFNVESVRKNGERTQWFPFDKFKFNEGQQVAWSLEHIHAQHSEGMRTQEAWKEWLRLHLESISTLGGNFDALKESMSKAISQESLERTKFDELQQQVLTYLSKEGNTEYLHSIANLALLNTSDNAALNNSTFDVKRNAIIRMDKAGQYIPFCTRMVFFKYYTSSARNQLYLWEKDDRIAYIQAINEVLEDYLAEEIVTEEIMTEREMQKYGDND